MLFVRVDDLKSGMRLGKPIYNKNGVLLYDRDSRLTMQAIVGIRNFGLMGLYILEPAEPVPPMSEADINFERFQTMAIFSIREDLDLIVAGKKDKGLDWLCSLIMKNYSGLDDKINFIQSLRSKEDFVYKHSLNVAILSTLIASQMGLPNGRINALVKSAILHDIGALQVSRQSMGLESNQETLEIIRKNTISLLKAQMDLDDSIVTNVLNMQEYVVKNGEDEVSSTAKANVLAKILYVADSYDKMTAMKSSEEPTSEVRAIRELLDHPENYDQDMVQALIRGINVLYPGVCVELSDHQKGLVISENTDNIFEPFVLSFSDNQLYDLSSPSIRDSIKITDVMKTMDNRIKIDPELLNQYL